MSFARKLERNIEMLEKNIEYKYRKIEKLREKRKKNEEKAEIEGVGRRTKNVNFE